MLNMFNPTAVGLAVSGIVAYLTYASGLIYSLMAGLLAWIVMLAPIRNDFWYASAGNNWSVSKIKNFYYVLYCSNGTRIKYTICSIYCI